MIKLIVCDIDGTLLDSHNDFDEQSFSKINEKRKQGIEFMFATGRDFDMVDKFCKEKQVFGPLILNNGTQYRSYDGQLNRIYPMQRESFEKIMDILLHYQYHISVHTQKGKYIFEDIESYFCRHVELIKKSRHLEDESMFPQADFFTREGFLRNTHEVKSIEELYQQGALPLKIDARHINPQMVKGVSQLFKDIGHLHISSSFEENIEITSDIHNKGTILKEILKEKGMTIEEVATFGDGLNDIGMLEEFPYSFAPFNAHPLAKEKASYSLDVTNEQGAVKKGIEILEELHLL
ncbi:MAG: HAD-IIB family hydrolase [Longibaculum sp.]